MQVAPEPGYPYNPTGTYEASVGEVVYTAEEVRR